MLSMRIALIVLLLCAAAARVVGAPPPPMMELAVGDKKVEGKVVAQTSGGWWLVGQDGRLSVFKSSEVSKSRQLSPQFHGWNSSIMKDQLRREFGRPYEVASTRHYLVVAKGDSQARLYAEMLENFFSTYKMYFSLRGFNIPEPEFPLVAIVFPSHEAFAKYAQQERQKVSKLVRGYYMPTSNRIAFFEAGSDSAARGSSADARFDGFSFAQNPFESHAAIPDGNPALIGQTAPHPWDSVEASLKDTLIHEATHQAAYNTGLHSRVGETPTWMVEGLATVFEAPGVRNSRSNSGVKSRINPERLVWFGNFVKDRRKPQSLEAFLAADTLFGASPLDAYSQAWALTFYLFETRPRNYAEYLRAVAARNPLEVYSPEARVADFKRMISRDIKLFEAEFLRYMAEIK